MKTMIIKNGTLVTEKDTFKSDILIEDGKIKIIGKDIKIKNNDLVIDATDRLILPGGVDVHTHLDLLAGKYRAVDDFYTGTMAACCGGTTTIIDHIAFGPKNCSLEYQINEYEKLAQGKAVIDYSFHGVIQHVNEEVLNKMEELVKKGITSFKIYMTYDFKLNDGEIFQILRKTKKLGVVIAVHAENDSLIETLRREHGQNKTLSPEYHAKSRPNLCEAEAIGRILKLARLAGDAPIYIVHLSTKEGLEEIKKARLAGQKNIYVETCPQYLLLTEKEYLRENNEGLKYIMSPPLRTEEDINELWKGITNNDIQVLATDHCPFNYNIEKQAGILDYRNCPNGAPGIEERMEVIFNKGVIDKKITINKFVEVTSTNPAKIYGCYPQKGGLLPGSDADLIIINPNSKKVIQKKDQKSSVDYTLYEGMKLTAKIEKVISNGEIIVDDGEFLGKKGRGKFLKREIKNK